MQVVKKYAKYSFIYIKKSARKERKLPQTFLLKLNLNLAGNQTVCQVEYVPNIRFFKSFGFFRSNGGAKLAQKELPL